MKNVILYISIFLLFSNIQIYSQGIMGTVVNEVGEKLELVNVLLYYTADSVFITGSITNQNGEFEVKIKDKKESYIKLSCIGYLEAVYPVDFENNQTKYVLKKNNVNLDEVVVTATKPIVKIDDGKLSFDVPSLIRQRAVNSAFDILGEVPGVEKNGDRISIIGANSTTIIINNRVSLMTTSKLVDYLKNVPPEQIKNIELLYSTPPQYGVKGSSINIIIDNYRKEKKERKAQLSFQGDQAHYFTPSVSTFYSSANQNSLLNVSYSFRHSNKYPTEKLDANHTLDNEMYSISLKNKIKSTSNRHNISLSYDYDLKNKDVISFSYSARVHDSDFNRYGVVKINDNGNISSTNKSNGPSGLHNASLSYTHAGFSTGIDYSYYNDETDQFLINSQELISDSIISASKQTVNKGAFHIRNQHRLRKKQTISYGLNAITSSSKNNQTVFRNHIADNLFILEQAEHSIDGFVGWAQSLGEKITLNASLSLEYYKATVNSKNTDYTLWKSWNLYPNLSMVYRIAPMKMFQLSFSSEKRYPSYWQTTPNVSYMNSYMTIEGNPEVQPSITHSGRLNFVLKGKYIFQLFGNISSDHIQQALYQSSDKLQAIYKIINLNKHNTFGTMVVLPFKAGNILDSRVVMSGFLIHDKGKLEDVFFSRKKLFGRISMNNNFYLNERKNLSFQLNGFYTTKAIQGIYDVKPMYDLSVGVAWSINQRLRINVMFDDILDGRQGRTVTQTGNQNYRQVINNDTRMLAVSVRYNIGGYKEKKTPGIDTSRFGIN